MINQPVQKQFVEERRRALPQYAVGELHCYLHCPISYFTRGVLPLFIKLFEHCGFQFVDLSLCHLNHLRALLGEFSARLLAKGLPLNLNFGAALLELLTRLFGALPSRFCLRLSARDFCFAPGNDRTDGLEEKALEQPYQNEEIDRLQRER